MSKCLEISKEIWRSLSLVWWNFSQVWSQKLWFFDSAIFECLHNTWLTFTRPSNYIISYHTFRGWKDSPKKIFLWIQNKLTLPDFCEKCRQINQSPFQMVWNSFLVELLGKFFCENVYNVLIELEVRRRKKSKPLYEKVVLIVNEIDQTKSNQKITVDLQL